jgi:hypothetical protein
LLIIGANKQLKSVALPDIFMYPIGRAGTLVFFTSLVDGKVVCRTLDLESETGAVVCKDFLPFAVTSQGKHLAAVGRGKDGRLQVYVLGGANPTRPRIFDLPVGVEALPLVHSLSFASDNRLLLINQVEASYVPLHLGKQLTAASKVVLRGAEIDQSRSWIAARNANLQRVALTTTKRDPPTKACRTGLKERKTTRKEQYVLAHMASKHGKNLFFLGPYRWQDGFRLVEFAEDGTEVRSYRLQIPDGGGVKPALSIRPSALCATADDLALMAEDGLARHYQRP